MSLDEMVTSRVEQILSGILSDRYGADIKIRFGRDGDAATAQIDQRRHHGVEAI